MELLKRRLGFRPLTAQLLVEKEIFFTISYVALVVTKQDCDCYEKLAFDFGEKALKTAITSKEGSRRGNYPIINRRGSDQT